MPWRLLTYRLAGDESRHRVAAWRELRRVGAVALQSGTWAVPAGVPFDEGLERATALVRRSGGHTLCFEVIAPGETLAILEGLYTAEREAEWVELCAACDEVEAGLRRGIEERGLTRAELDAAGQRVDRLRRSHRDLRAKDLFGAPSAAHGERRLEECTKLVEALAQDVRGPGRGGRRAAR